MNRLMLTNQQASEKRITFFLSVAFDTIVEISFLTSIPRRLVLICCIDSRTRYSIAYRDANV